MPEPHTDQVTEPFLSPSEAAARLHVGINTIRRWIREGRVSGARRSPGGRLRIPLSDVDAIFKAVPRAER